MQSCFHLHSAVTNGIQDEARRALSPLKDDKESSLDGEMQQHRRCISVRGLTTGTLMMESTGGGPGATYASHPFAAKRCCFSAGKIDGNVFIRTRDACITTP